MSARPTGPIVLNVPLTKGEELIHSFLPCPTVFRRQHIRLGIGAMLAGTAVLWLLRNPYFWAGAMIGMTAIAAYGLLVARHELSERWDLTDRRLLGPGQRIVPLSDISQLRARGTTVQVLTHSGDRHMLKYQPDRDTTRLMIHAVINGNRK